MRLPIALASTFVLSTVVLAAAPARAGDVAVTAAQFTDAVTKGKPAGDAAAAASAPRVTYWIEVKSPSAATQVTLLWKVDGKEAARQVLDVGRSPRWRTWGHLVPRDARRIEVEVLDDAGAQLRADALDRR